MRARARAVGFLLAPLAGMGCGSLEGELLEALQGKEQSELCVQPPMLGVDAFEANDGKRYVAKAGDFSFVGAPGAVNALDALKSKGYVSDQATSLPRTFASSFDAFAITEKGSEYLRPDQFGAGFEACIGEKTATEIIDYTEPGEGNPQATQARFRYEIRFNDFVDELEIEDALQGEVSRAWPGEGIATYVKTNEGWRLELARWQ